MVTMKCCPVGSATKYVGKKWSINIVRDLFMGKKRFSEFMESNPGISTKMLSERLKELEKNDIIKKDVVNKTPITIEYSLTKKGRALNRIMYELAAFSITQYHKEVCGKSSEQECLKLVKKAFL